MGIIRPSAPVLALTGVPASASPIAACRASAARWRISDRAAEACCRVVAVRVKRGDDRAGIGQAFLIDHQYPLAPFGKPCLDEPLQPPSHCRQIGKIGEVGHVLAKQPLNCSADNLVAG